MHIVTQSAQESTLLERIRQGLTYEAYRSEWERHIQRPLKGLDKNARKYLFYARYNWERAERLAAVYEMSPEMRQAVDAVAEPQWWMVLTESWCVDSAYALPIFSAATIRNPRIIMRILSRDENLDLMDRYLTNGGRSIPKLVAFSEDGEELFQWGPRPAELQAARARWIEARIAGPDISRRTVEWYEAGGWRAIEIEMTNLLRSLQTDHT